MKSLIIRSFLTGIALLSFSAASGGEKEDILLLVRADDIGSSHTANLACIEACVNGIARSVEIMVPCPWFPEAARLLADHTGIDVGVHLTLTSEWEAMKWRPVTCAPSLVDSDGYFFPMVWQRDDFPPHTALKDAPWKPDEIEKELRGQIELAKRRIPRLSHVSGHMGFESIGSEIKDLVRRLEKEYGLEVELPADVRPVYGSGDAKTFEEKRKEFVKALENLKPGVYIHVDHPGADTPEMRAIGHKGYYTVAEERDAVTRLFTDETVREAILKKNIRLVGYDHFRKTP